MAPVYARPRWVRIVSNAIAVIMLALTVVMVAVGDWFLAVVGAVIAVPLLLGNSPLFKVAINREPDAIACRYVPWYEPGPVAAVPALAVSGILGLALAFQPGNSPVFAVFGVALLALTPVVALKFLRGYRRCFLRITPTALRVPDPGREWAVTDIPRERIQAIGPATDAVGFGSTNLLLTEIVYGGGDLGSGAARRVQLGPAPAEGTVWLSVKPDHLLTALQRWKEGDPRDPHLLDHVDAVLREGVPVRS
jgi:hypothetical protein